jgi:transcription elongation GreA/GreB family factor
MTLPDDIRQLLLRECLRAFDDKIASAKQNLITVRESVDSETKSTAGDKHETGRAMAQIELEKAQRQLNELLHMKNDLLRISPGRNPEKIAAGSVVVTDKLIFFISVPLGAIKISEAVFYAISPVSPIGSALLGKQAGDAIELNRTVFNIISVH